MWILQMLFGGKHKESVGFFDYTEDDKYKSYKKEDKNI